MKIPIIRFILSVHLMGGVLFADELINQHANNLHKIAAEYERSTNERVIQGDDSDWFFLRSELFHVAKGRFWEKNWKDISVSGEDPLSIFTLLKEQLDPLGVDLIFVPVPSKFIIYPEKLSESVPMEGKLPVTNSQYELQPYLKRFKEAGINVIDLEPILKNRRKTESFSSYCMTDSHPSPWTCQMIAGLLSEKINSLEWAKEYQRDSGISFIKSEPRNIKILGDLIPEDKRESWGPESLLISQVHSKSDGKLTPVIPDDKNSPVIVLGDSHTLIFHEGDDMHASGSGLVDHLQEKIGFKVFLAATRGSSSQALRQIYKGPEFWKGKKLLIWVSSVREFTEERRWLKLPRIPR
jgi:alginate O-acetyltransferase complex protein AlgJ